MGSDTTRGRVLGRSLLLAATSVAFTVGYWWTKGFRLRLIADAGNALQKCDTVFVTPLHYLLVLGFQVPYCAALAVIDVRTWLWIQVGLWALAVVLVYRAGAHLFDEPTGLLAGGAMAVTWETFRFALRPQSDLLLLFTVAVALWALARNERLETRRSRLLVAASALLVAITKPLGFPLVFGWGVWKLLSEGRGSAFDPRSPSPAGVAFYLGLAAISLFVVWSFFLPRLDVAYTDPDLYWRHGGFLSTAASGIVVTHPHTPTVEYLYRSRPASTVPAWLLLNADHLLVLGLWRASFFFVPVLPRWSTFHVVVNAVTILPLVVGTVAGARRLLAQRRYDRFGLLVAPVVANLLTVAILYVDGGFNYRAPSTLAFALLTAYWVRGVAADYGVDEPIENRLRAVENRLRAVENRLWAVENRLGSLDEPAAGDR